MTDRSPTRIVTLDGRSIETRTFQPSTDIRPDAGTVDEAMPTRVVLLHEGLGSVALWRTFPQRLADALGEPVLAYSRHGYGGSEPWDRALTPQFMHDEAARALPDLLHAQGIAHPVLVGHSDGASIALLHASLFPGVARGVVALAPHLFVEDVTVASIAAARRDYDTTELAQRFARHHRDGHRTFTGWSDAWLDPAFRDWNIEPEVARIVVPVLAIQGEQDQYGTIAQIDRIAELLPQARLLKLADCRHSPHLDRPDEVLAAIAAFVATLDGR
jgi:pimeloyl-ACP methyl ester carboxylesterase